MLFAYRNANAEIPAHHDYLVSLLDLASGNALSR